METDSMLIVALCATIFAMMAAGMSMLQAINLGWIFVTVSAFYIVLSVGSFAFVISKLFAL